MLLGGQQKIMKNEKIREERQKEAQRVLKLSQKFQSLVDIAFDNTDYIASPLNYTSEFKISGVNHHVKDNNKHKKDIIKFTDDDTITSLRKAKEKYEDDEIKNFCILNFASYKKPGGGFLNGSKSQEEDICMSSFLYPVLERFKSVYKYRKKRGGEYGHDLFYSKDMPILNKERTMRAFDVDVISCSAPNRGVMKKNGIVDGYIAKVLTNRIEAIFKIAIAHNVDCLILGAFGTGVFKNNDYTVAAAFDMMCEKYHRFFKKIIFAIPDKNKLKTFKGVIL